MWEVEFHDEFFGEASGFSVEVQDKLAARIRVLEELGPTLGRPWADTLNGSAYSNMKELRFNADNGVWRVAFAFNPKRKAILLVGGDKAGANEKQFYKDLIKIADKRYKEHLKAI